MPINDCATRSYLTESVPARLSLTNFSPPVNSAAADDLEQLPEPRPVPRRRLRRVLPASNPLATLQPPRRQNLAATSAKFSAATSLAKINSVQNEVNKLSGNSLGSISLQLLPYLDLTSTSTSSALAQVEQVLVAMPGDINKILMLTTLLTTLGALIESPKLELKDLQQLFGGLSSFRGSYADFLEVLADIKSLLPANIRVKHPLDYWLNILELVKNLEANISTKDRLAWQQYLQDCLYLQKSKRWGSAHLKFMVRLTSIPLAALPEFTKLVDYVANLLSYREICLERNSLLLYLAELPYEYLGDFQELLAYLQQGLGENDHQTTKIVIKFLINFIDRQNFAKSKKIILVLMDTLLPLHKINLASDLVSIPVKHLAEVIELAVKLTANTQGSSKYILINYVLYHYFVRKAKLPELLALVQELKDLQEAIEVVIPPERLRFLLDTFITAPFYKEYILFTPRSLASHLTQIVNERKDIIKDFKKFKEYGAKFLSPDLRFTALLVLTYLNSRRRQEFVDFSANPISARRELEGKLIFLRNLQILIDDFKIHVAYSKSNFKILHRIINELYDKYKRRQQSADLVEVNSSLKAAIEDFCRTNRHLGLFTKLKWLAAASQAPLPPPWELGLNLRELNIYQQNHLPILDAYIQQHAGAIFQNSGFKKIYLDQATLNRLVGSRCPISLKIYHPAQEANDAAEDSETEEGSKDDEAYIKRPILVVSFNSKIPQVTICEMSALLGWLLRQNFVPDTRVLCSFFDLYIIANDLSALV